MAIDQTISWVRGESCSPQRALRVASSTGATIRDATSESLPVNALPQAALSTWSFSAHSPRATRISGWSKRRSSSRGIAQLELDGEVALGCVFAFAAHQLRQDLDLEAI